MHTADAAGSGITSRILARSAPRKALARTRAVGVGLVFTSVSLALSLVCDIARGLVVLRLLRPQQWLALRMALFSAVARATLSAARVRIERQAGPAGLRLGLLVCNHVSWLDSFVLAAVYRCNFVIRQEQLKPLYMKWLARAFGAIALDTTDPFALPAAVATGREWLEAGQGVAFFPEGTCGSQGGLLPFHSSLLDMAAQGEVPVVPLALRYEPAETFPDWHGTESLAENVMRVAACGPFAATIRAGALMRPLSTTDRSSVIRSCRGEMARLLNIGVEDTPESSPSSRETLESLGYDSLRLVELCIELEHLGCPHHAVSSLTLRSTMDDVSAVRRGARGKPAANGEDACASQHSNWLTRDYPSLRLPARVALAALATGIWAGAAVVTGWISLMLAFALGPLSAAAAAVPVFFTSFAAIAGICSLPSRWAIQPLTIRTSLGVPMYFARRWYGVCWTSVYYFKAAYAFVLAIPALKRMTFRLFGYRGSMDFTTYPDTWIRDLPLLEFGQGVYLSNRATLGTNVLPGNGTIMVGPIRLGAGTLVGHLAVVGLNTRVGESASVGVGAHVGIGVDVGPGARIGPSARIGHYATVRAGEVLSPGAMRLADVDDEAPAAGWRPVCSTPKSSQTVTSTTRQHRPE